ncbi:unnamed protein product [Phytophthora fragariaefolia]|uniref:Unnamed protein product n=1 Tax=Phytophthora fragariaefolia TaxID=1490495 RepID=A0A9W6U8L7_9STRA|nr:unnamed protein product [Phytophthora fragariaefolia]
MPWQTLPTPSIKHTGNHGVVSLHQWAGRDGSLQKTHLAGSDILQLTAGHKAQTATITGTNSAPSTSRSPASSGFIVAITI